MTAAGWLLVAAFILLLGLLLYWQVNIAEGAYFGARVVALLYDWSAERYNNIKEFLIVEDIDEVSIGQSIIAKSVFVGMEKAVKEMIDLIRQYSVK